MGVSMGKKLVPIFAIILMVVPVVSFALGLGPITMRSGLNQPLLAEIDIHSLQPGDLDGLVVSLASADDFKRIDVVRQKFLSQIKFSVDFKADGSAYIKLVTTKPITEPFIELLVEAKWPRGRALKPYTVLVDPPVLTAEAPAPVQQAATAPVFAEPRQSRKSSSIRQSSTRQSSARRNRPNTELQTPKSVAKRRQQQQQQQQQQASVASAPAKDFSNADGSLNYGRVKRGETLSSIAKKMRRSVDISVSTQQMMIALLKSNPGAFVGDNINQLKAGHILRIEDSSVLDTLSQSDAMREVRRQTQEWNSSKGRGRLVRQSDEPDFASDDDMSSSTSSSSSQGKSRETEQAQLKLVAPGREGLGVSGAGEDSENGQVREELMLANETLEANQQETSELKSRISDLEEQLTSMQRLIMLKDEEMLGLQNNLSKEDVKPEVEAKPELDETQQQLAAEEEAKPVALEEEEGFFSDTLMLLLAVLLVVGMVVGLVVRRRKMQQGFEESILNVGMSATVGASAAAMSTPMSQPQESGIVSDFAMSDMGGIQSDTTEVDPISEADVYLAYGRHQQAQDILEQAIESDPERLELHAKLLEVYHGAGNKDAFDNHAKILHEKVGGDESNEYWARVVSLGSEVSPENPLFGGGGADLAEQTLIQPAIGGVGVTPDDEDLLDFEFEENNEPTEIFNTKKSAEADIDDDSLLDFDMDSLDFNLDEELPDDALASLDELDQFDSAIAETENASGAASGGLELEMPSDTVSFENTAVTQQQGEDELTFSLDSFDMANEAGATSQSDGSGLSFVDESSGDEAFNLSLVDEEGLPEEDQPGLEAFENSAGDGLDDDIFANVDEIGTKLDLAKAYVDMGDSDGARSILDEVIEEGDDSQKQQAEELLQQMG